MRNPFLAAQVLRSLRDGKPTLITKVATRWLKKASDEDFDVLARLQVLEGAAGLRAGAWSNRGRAGLRQAMGHFEGSPLDPNWFARQSGMYRLLKATAQRILSTSRVTNVDADDLLQNALAGLT